MRQDGLEGPESHDPNLQKGGLGFTGNPASPHRYIQFSAIFLAMMDTWFFEMWRAAAIFPCDSCPFSMYREAFRIFDSFSGTFDIGCHPFYDEKAARLLFRTASS